MAPLTTVPPPVKLRAADYLMLDEAGAFEPYGKTELLDGEIVYSNAQHRPHGRVKMALYDALHDALREPLRRFRLRLKLALNWRNTTRPNRI